MLSFAEVSPESLKRAGGWRASRDSVRALEKPNPTNHHGLRKTEGSLFTRRRTRGGANVS